MQKEYLIETRAVADEKGTLLNLKYYLIEEEQACIPASPVPDLYQEIPVRESGGGGDREHAARVRFRKPGALPAFAA